VATKEDRDRLVKLVQAIVESGSEELSTQLTALIKVGVCVCVCVC
jgi:hypothetical protein